ncbi:MAG: DUF1834 family protein [Alphaproteobacteria bacterium]|nr:DUF1834 family protein [Alphaproteobacteria bacterium]
MSDPVTGIGQIENAIAARIKQASNGDALGYKLKKVESYSGQFDTDEFAQLTAQFPCALVAYVGDWQPPERRQGGRQVFPKFAILCGSKNLRNQAAGRIGSDNDVGSVQIAADIRMLLSEQMLGLQMDPLEPGAAVPVINSTTRDRYASVISIEFLGGYFEQARKPVGEDGNLETYFSQWDVPPHAAPPEDPALPRAADKVDSQQTVQLPQD